MKMRILLACLALAAPGGAAAQTAPFDMNRLKQGVDQMAMMAADMAFARADANRDGVVDRREAHVAGTGLGLQGTGPEDRVWAAVDLDRNGQVTRAELRAAFVAVQARVAAGGQPF